MNDKYNEFINAIVDNIDSKSLSPKLTAKALIELGVSITMYHTTNPFFGFIEVNRLVSEGIAQYVKDFEGEKEDE